MNKKNAIFPVFCVLSVSLLTASLITILLTDYYSKMQFRFLNTFCGEIINEYPDSRLTVLERLKTIKEASAADTDENILCSFGYRPSDFGGANRQVLKLSGTGFLLSGALFLFALAYRRKQLDARIKALTNDLETINTGGQGLLLAAGEDEFSKLRDELYKTVTALYQTRDMAWKAKTNYADNLSNIAHQLKTPITAISLSVQRIKEHPASDYHYIEQIQRQLHRLTHLEEALLILSRIDAGTLSLKQTSVDVFTLLTLASDNLQELSIQHGIDIDVQEAGEIHILADLDWTMEAIMNLMKNGMEHTAAGTAVHCSYEQNPLYVQIRIWDEGHGFAEEDLPHLFERFYHGKNGGAGGIGIGLSLAKEIIEMQNGIIRALNLHEGGACFEIRFYCH